MSSSDSFVIDHTQAMNWPLYISEGVLVLGLLILGLTGGIKWIQVRADQIRSNVDDMKPCNKGKKMKLTITQRYAELDVHSHVVCEMAGWGELHQKKGPRMGFTAIMVLLAHRKLQNWNQENPEIDCEVHAMVEDIEKCRMKSQIVDIVRKVRANQKSKMYSEFSAIAGEAFWRYSRCTIDEGWQISPFEEENDKKKEIEEV